MTRHEKVLQFIKLIKGPSVLELYEIESYECDFAKELNIDEWCSTDKIMEEIFTTGCCGRFYLILKQLFPSALPYLVTEDSEGNNVLHIITRIDSRFYDINGEYDVTNAKFKEIDEEELLMNDVVDNYSFKNRGPII